MNKQEYNGWSNYETWNVNLWLNNEQASQELWEDRARRIRAEVTKAKEPWVTAEQEHEEALWRLAEQLVEHYDKEVDSWIGDKPFGCFTDMLLASLREVNWREIAEHLLEDIQVES